MPKAPGYRRHRVGQPIKRRDLEGNANARGYDRRWRKSSRAYLDANPLCVPCLFRGITQAAECVDHIIPHRGDSDLFDDEDNWCAACIRCNSIKAVKEQVYAFAVRDRLVLCGLPATGKAQEAKRLRLPYWDTDEVAHRHGWGDYPRQDEQARELIRMRADWLVEQPPRCVVIAAHPWHAMEVAATIGARVKHMTCDESERAARLARRRTDRQNGSVRQN